ncbi:MAG: metallophosphoesterase, partial [Clostridia bacterium]|nr:metallophosphoesterase [Clostridia bacterium]
MTTPENQYKNIWEYKTEADEVVSREVTIKTQKGGEPLEIIQITDLHFNYCTEEDLKDPVLKSTYENRKWLRDGKSVANALRCLEYAKNADQLVITGDILDYLSQGTLELTKKHIFDAFPNVMACLGNHDAVRRMQGTVAENTSLESRMEIVKNAWIHDAEYYAGVLDERVMLIQMDNASDPSQKYGSFSERQAELFEKDLKLAREKGYTVLLFYHIPLATGNPADYSATASMVGDKNGSVRNLYTGGIGKHSVGASREVYDLITRNADIIGGAFCGHDHNDFYTEIKAKNADGTDAVIPQYILIGVPYGKG